MRRALLTSLAIATFVVVGAAAASSRDSALHTVLASKQGAGFDYFPRHVGTSACRIPFVFRSVKGTCTVRVAARRGYSGQTFVNLSERWRWRDFHYSGTPRGP